ncbi:MAG: hypothetical protein HY553_04510 [Elusimicrobia bacterium]|nr:hypothetical protein [Elusimicrobiota bacterium]
MPVTAWRHAEGRYEIAGLPRESLYVPADERDCSLESSVELGEATAPSLAD